MIGLIPFITIKWQQATQDGGAPILGYFVSAYLNVGPFILLPHGFRPADSTANSAFQLVP
jgi:hypothetical protein